MEARIIGTLLAAIATTFLPSILEFPSMWLYTGLVSLASYVAFVRLKNWRIIVLTIVTAYLVQQIPPLIDIFTFSNNAFAIITSEVYKNGMAAHAIISYWHLLILPAIALLVAGYILISICSKWGQEDV